jgi:hypothetical protein
MKNALIITAFSAFILVAASCGGGSTTPALQATEQDKAIIGEYTCPMHPEVQSDKPGSCPKCGMELVRKDSLMSGDTMKVQPADSMKM